MNKIGWIAGIAVLMAGVSQADLVYSTDFNTTSYDGGNGAFVLGGATPDVTAEDWFGATQGVTFGPTALTLNYAVANRYRGSGVWLDASAWTAGTVTVGVEVSGYTAGVGDSSILFQTFAANGVDAANSVSMDLHGGPGADGGPVSTGSATVAMFGTEQNISGAATQDFTFTYNGTDQFIALVFALESAKTGVTTYEAATLDNLTVNTIPEPAVLSFVVIFGGGILVLKRRFS